jgi:hypothetical protein
MHTNRLARCFDLRDLLSSSARKKKGSKSSTREDKKMKDLREEDARRQLARIDSLMDIVEQKLRDTLSPNKDSTFFELTRTAESLLRYREAFIGITGATSLPQEDAEIKDDKALKVNEALKAAEWGIPLREVAE